MHGKSPGRKNIVTSARGAELRGLDFLVEHDIAALGVFAVGKTSLVRRFVESMFSDQYQTTLDVKVEQKMLRVDGRDLNVILRDIRGDDELQAVAASYLRGMSGCALVADSTREKSLEIALAVRAAAGKQAGNIPFVLLLNKVDLADRWEIGATAQVMALSGMLPGRAQVPGAVQAARDIQQAVKALRGSRFSHHKELKGVGIGMASGFVALGIVGTSTRRSFSAIGHTVNPAARLESQAQPGQLLVDENCYSRLGSLKNHFTQVTLSLKGLSRVTAYSLDLVQAAGIEE